MVATLFVVSLAPQSRGPIFASPSGKVVGRVMGTLGPVLPSEAREILAPFWDGRAAVADSGRRDDQDPGDVEEIRTSEFDHGRGRAIERR
jgi:membrane protein required for colicin V production